MTPEAAEQNRQRAREWRQLPGNKEREAARKTAWKVAHPEEWAARRKASSVRYIEKNREGLRAKRNSLRADLRTAAIIAYGGRCNCFGCHVHHAVLLTIDHVHGDAHHRSSRGRSTRDLYRRLQRLGYPPEYQLLCGSCNLAKSDREQCPLAGEDH